MTTKETKYVYFRESFWSSVAADCFMFGRLCGATGMNYIYFGDSPFWGVIRFGMILMAATSRARHRAITFYSVADLKKHVDQLEAAGIISAPDPKTHRHTVL